MPSGRFCGLISSSPKVDVVIDVGNPFLNRTVDGFIKIGTVAASSVAVEETYHCLRKVAGSISKAKAKDSIESSLEGNLIFLDYHFLASKPVLTAELKKMCKEGAYWGTVAGVYVGMEYGVERIRGTRDWKNAMLGGAISGALISAASNKNKDQIIVDAIRGGAVTTAAEFLNYLT